MYAHGVKVAARLIVLFALPADGEGFRLGITATRRVGGAVVRNRARRRIRELVRRQAEVLEGWSGDVVINVRRGCSTAPWQELEGEYLRCVLRAQKILQRRASS